MLKEEFRRPLPGAGREVWVGVEGGIQEAPQRVLEEGGIGLGEGQGCL